VSHELRTPLTSICGALGLLASGKLRSFPEKAQRMLVVANENITRLVRLINDVLDLEKLQSGMADMAADDIDLRALLVAAAEAMQPMAEKAAVSLVVDTAAVTVKADGDRLMQAVTNLVSNAIKFSTSGGRVILRARSGDGKAVIEVEDEGRGIPADKIDLVFQRFQQVDASDSRDKGGTGLGLAIVKRIVEQHGGAIGVESEVGRGSCFAISLPLVQHLGRLACAT
jgi:signal transduction histidine kinase